MKLKNAENCTGLVFYLVPLLNITPSLKILWGKKKKEQTTCYATDYVRKEATRLEGSYYRSFSLGFFE